MEQMIQKEIQVNGSWIQVDVYGAPDGPAIVVIPGVMADAAAWGPVAQHLEGWPSIAVVNRRGRVPSGPLTSTYTLETEIEDATAVLRSFCNIQTVLGWSYGGLIALHLADRVPVAHLIAYEPIMAPFGAPALPDLKAADDAQDLDQVAEVALRQVAAMPSEVVGALRSDSGAWSALRELSAPLYQETLAINQAPLPTLLARRADRIDLVVGERNRGQAPYGTTFDDIVRRVPTAAVHELAGQAHLAHLEAPDHLAALVNRLREPRRTGS
ncbi:alpha/beta hydrolase [Kineosporia rhizophila]|uniref:alpha/beta fold hydrolase n=1 Tax=Kineosporia rhizophila TaxID=84633 RepID=UPI001E3C9880|nr:alpha/beta fold hydrolase [Kineosporia rhizophila]MCE0538589.1 alpha/beta hydrolase [Kineosporia rhizophila]